MSNPEWREDLNRLLVRFSAAGLALDVDTDDLTRLWAVYCGLRRLLGDSDMPKRHLPGKLAVNPLAASQ